MKDLRKHVSTNKLKQFLLVCLMVVGMFPKAFSQQYFQQKVNYTIDVSLNDKKHELTAFEKVEYINHSPDTLQFLYFHLWPNAYSNNKTELAKQLFMQKGKEKLFNDPELMGYIDSLDFKVNNLPVLWNLLPNQPDICKIILNTALLPGETIVVSTPFHVKIPKGVTSRLGHIDESYQISQWYPKPAVYDKTGWHQMPYLDQGEFYSEFGSFDVNITLPENYVVGATGNLQNIHEAEMLDTLATDTTWKSISMLGKVKHIPSSVQTKTLRYTGTNIHDFAWFADKQFKVMKGKVILPESGREVTIWVMFTNRQSRLWKNSLEYANQAILGFSNLIGDYPYSSFTVIQSALSAGLGMEYPGLTVIGHTKNAYSLDKVIAHEACHNWFYAALGSNERRFPFMDEGITNSYEVRYLAERYPEKKLWEIFFKKQKQAKFFHVDKIPAQRMMELEWLLSARSNTEQPVNMASTDYNVMNYNLIVYNKAAIGFNYLRAYLGDSLFDSIIHDYYRQWKFRHPQPDDLRRVFESHTDKDVSWFFDDLMGTTKRLDYKMVRYQNRQLLIRNAGELTSPVLIAGLNNDSVCFEKWVDGFAGQKWIAIPPGNFTGFKIDPKHVMPELYRLNNNIRASGIFPKVDPVQPQFLFSIEDPEKHSFMYIPAVNWNHENGFMVGVALHNGFVTPKPFEYFIMPFYTFNNSMLAGFGRISYNIIPYNNFIRLATITLQGTQFGAPGNQSYRKLMAGLDINFRANKVTNPIRQKIYGRYILASDLYQIENIEHANMNPYMQLGYNLQKASLVNPYNLLVSVESGETFQKAAVDFNYKFSYTGKNNGLEIRLFAATMLNNTSTNNFYALAPGGRSGREQYLYEGIYPDRFGVFPTSFWSRQMTVSEGSLVSPVNDKLGYSNWLISLSLSSNLPGKAGRTGIKPFINLLLNDHGLGVNNNSPFFGEAGLKVGFWNIFEIYFPLLVTGNIQSITGSIKNRVRIVFNLDFSKSGKIGTGIGN
ncbi:MAG: M1 family metallopeptidase [Bacteroidales bacterium]|nr:M1 family metallopeptidase [Bacteroidales bacterium]